MQKRHKQSYGLLWRLLNRCAVSRSRHDEVGGTGLEQQRKTLIKQGCSESRTVKSAALSANSAKLLAMCGDDAELAELIAVWPGLPDDLRAVILRLARAS